MNIKALLVDDEKSSRDELCHLIEKYHGLEVCGETSSGIEALKLTDKLKPDVVFLDVCIPDCNGLEVANRLISMDKSPYVVFTTAYDKYAIDAFELNAIDYILKPFSKSRLDVTIQRIKIEIDYRQSMEYRKKISNFIDYFMRKKSSKVIPVWNKNRIILIKPKNIVYITIREKRTIIKTFQQEYISSYCLAELETILEEYLFFRTHRSYLVNTNYIKEIIPWFNNTYQLIMEGYEKIKIPVSRTHIQDFRSYFSL